MKECAIIVYYQAFDHMLTCMHAYQDLVSHARLLPKQLRGRKSLVKAVLCNCTAWQIGCTTF